MSSCLLTVGCSFIEGSGGFPKEFIEYCKPLKKNKVDELKNLYDPRWFTLNGIGHNLQKKLNYNRLINIGIGNSSIELQIDELFRLVDLKKLKQQHDKVTVFLLLSYPSRYNKYINGESIAIAMELHKTIGVSKKQKTDNIYEDAVKDQIKYINILGSICELNEWNFVWGCVDPVQEKIIKTNKLSNYLNELIRTPFDGTDEVMIDFELLRNNGLLSFDPHPNKEGYERIAENIYQWIKKNKPQLINSNDINDYIVERICNRNPHAELETINLDTKTWGTLTPWG